MYPTVIRGARLNDQIVECGRLFGHKPACLVPVVSWSDYAERRQASVSDTQKIGWIMRSAYSGVTRASFALAV